MSIKRKRSKLQKKIDDPNSRYWKTKADSLWRKLVVDYWGHACVICGSSEFTQAHHMIPREQCSHRHIVRNGICLCAKHHRFSFEISAHKAPVTFFKWMLQNRPDLFSWLMEQEPTRKSSMTYKETAAKLSEQFPNVSGG